MCTLVKRGQKTVDAVICERDIETVSLILALRSSVRSWKRPLAEAQARETYGQSFLQHISLGKRKGICDVVCKVSSRSHRQTNSGHESQKASQIARQACRQKNRQDFRSCTLETGSAPAQKDGETDGQTGRQAAKQIASITLSLRI